MKIFESVLFLTLVTAILFCSSTAFTHGYFNILELDSDLLERSFHQTLYQGMYLILSKLFILFIILIVITSVHYILRLLFQEQSNVDNNNHLFPFNLLYTSTIKDGRRLEAKYTRIILYFLTALILLVLFAILMNTFETKGKNQAYKIKRDIKDSKFGYVTFTADKKDKKLAYLYCGNRNCAAFDTELKGIKYFPQNGHYYFPKKENSDLSEIEIEDIKNYSIFFPD